ncbi:hypothetical protein UFOVP55_35 [uncultured Caudovirales phage]|uniref:Uncharacterized protein n=1 Tax=uncultured Caudovirales phage TaxID=2100421 RepID=A0A6J5KR23_9CAUD|nr:hypothetical protein UFOVP55_35 [uncultured Caudovirales phage]
MSPDKRDLLIDHAAIKERAAQEKAEYAKRDVIRNAEAKAAKGDKSMQCMLHLWDLKRFGYSPTRTELNIPRDRPQVLHRPTDPTRIYSSSPSSW